LKAKIYINIYFCSQEQRDRRQSFWKKNRGNDCSNWAKSKRAACLCFLFLFPPIATFAFAIKGKSCHLNDHLNDGSFMQPIPLLLTDQRQEGQRLKITSPLKLSNYN